LYNHGNNEIGNIPKEDLDSKVLDIFYKILPSLPKMQENEIDCIISTDNTAFQDAYINIITESHYKHNFLSEKIFKAYIAEQIPIIVGPARSMLFLKDIGFDTFLDIIDYTKFDEIQEWQFRIDSIHQTLDKIMNLDFDTIYHNTRDRRKDNQNYLYSDTIIQKIVDPIRSQISM
jgi:hypothetical protein